MPAPVSYIGIVVGGVRITFKEVFALFAVRALGVEHLLALVAGVVCVLVLEAERGYEAVVFAALAHYLFVGVFQRLVYVVEADETTLREVVALRFCLGVECRAKCAHHFGGVGGGEFLTRHQFQRTIDRRIPERAALHDDGLAEFGEVFEFQYFKQRILDDAVCQSRRNVGDSGVFAEALFHLAVHKDGAARAEVAGRVGSTGLLRKVGSS